MTIPMALSIFSGASSLGLFLLYFFRRKRKPNSSVLYVSKLCSYPQPLQSQWAEIGDVGAYIQRYFKYRDAIDGVGYWTQYDIKEIEYVDTGECCFPQPETRHERAYRLYREKEPVVQMQDWYFDKSFQKVVTMGTEKGFQSMTQFLRRRDECSSRFERLHAKNKNRRGEIDTQWVPILQGMWARGGKGIFILIAVVSAVFYGLQTKTLIPGYDEDALRLLGPQPNRAATNEALRQIAVQTTATAQYRIEHPVEVNAWWLILVGIAIVLLVIFTVYRAITNPRRIKKEIPMMRQKRPKEKVAAKPNSSVSRPPTRKA